MASGDLMNNRYEVVRKLGEGGKSEVYLVRDRNEHNME
jgi:serine/threonine protein kinase